MPDPHAPARRGTARRDFLRLALLAPVAAAVTGCATPGGKETSAAAATAGAKEGAEPTAADAIRAVPLAMDVEPAFVFRAGRGE